MQRRRLRQPQRPAALLLRCLLLRRLLLLLLLLLLHLLHLGRLLHLRLGRSGLHLMRVRLLLRRGQLGGLQLPLLRLRDRGRVLREPGLRDRAGAGPRCARVRVEPRHSRRVLRGDASRQRLRLDWRLRGRRECWPRRRRRGGGAGCARIGAWRCLRRYGGGLARRGCGGGGRLVLLQQLRDLRVLCLRDNSLGSATACAALHCS